MTKGPTRATDHTYRSSSCRTTCSSKWRRDARVLGSLPYHAMGFWCPSPWCNTHAGKIVPFFVVVGPDGQFWGRRPLIRSTIVSYRR